MNKLIFCLGFYAVILLILCIFNLVYCVDYGDCFIDDSRHTHGGEFLQMFLYQFGIEL